MFTYIYFKLCCAYCRWQKNRRRVRRAALSFRYHPNAAVNVRRVQSSRSNQRYNTVRRHASLNRSRTRSNDTKSVRSFNRWIPLETSRNHMKFWIPGTTQLVQLLHNLNVSIPCPYRVVGKLVLKVEVQTAQCLGYPISRSLKGFANNMVATVTQKLPEVSVVEIYKNPIRLSIWNSCTLMRRRREEEGTRLVKVQLGSIKVGLLNILQFSVVTRLLGAALRVVVCSLAPIGSAIQSTCLLTRCLQVSSL